MREDGFRSSGLRFDRAGANRVLEVHPRAALLLWGLNHKGYKTSRDPSRREEEAAARADLLSAIEAQAPWLRWAPGAHQACLDSDDAHLARLEGWAHLPPHESLPLLASRG